MSFLTTLVGSKVAVSAITLGGLALGGTTAAAYTGTLPQPLQHVAHQYVGAPLADETGDAESMPVPSISDSASPEVSASAPLVLPSEGVVSASPTGTPVGPDATGPAAYGLCTAYTHGGVKAGSIAYTALVTAAQAKGAADIPAYCTGVIAAKHATHTLKTKSTETSTESSTEDSATPSVEPTKESHKHSHVKSSTRHSSSTEADDESDSQVGEDSNDDSNSAGDNENDNQNQNEND
jgi:hypothetical protein